ncbi:FAD-dependent monooxygenase [Stackebrandtia nassauensis]|uniref:Monooxygenase FAD-binding protein n=1 Tax=Stackebrandtia nassauensis (strain DSM 44728 / CIP 108903 / NRRL B-16338 / NBRC 102104 / LLR-40K-21) TaxID=446470 RepID=D3Q1V6_STANL|nr:FAD-dependent monooxygenase [Stackebrandtia nassauensis]ADD41823.1 monooxygenase FAD-binding protein [Stackebrandtia nassauensis DSM 44728]
MNWPGSGEGTTSRHGSWRRASERRFARHRPGPPTRTSVLIVGGGLAGLSTALFLSWHGVSCVLVEQHTDVPIHPRMRGLPPPLVELYRPLGLETRLTREADDFARRGSFDMVRAETLAAEHTPMGMNLDPTRATSSSPCRNIPISQDKTERVLRQRAVELGADIRFGVRLEGFSDDSTGVSARLRATDESLSSVRASYLVAADGPESALRERMGIGMAGPGEISRMLSIMFETDSRLILGDRTVHMAYLERPFPGTFLFCLDAEGQRWVLGCTDPDEWGKTNADCEALVQVALGRRVPIRLLTPIPGSNQPALRFALSAAVADRFSDGRVFLVGDAAHHIPPPGGFGGFCGVADAYNLAWKLAAVLEDRADRALLDSYDTERRPAAEFTVRQAMARAGERLGGHWSEDSTTIVDRTRVMTGYRYGPGPIIGAAPGAVGTRFPHLWLEPGKSTIDLFGSGFVLLTPTDGHAWTVASHDAVTIHRLDRSLPGVESDGAILVRPDGFVAWRSRTAVADPHATLTDVVNRILNGPSPIMAFAPPALT